MSTREPPMTSSAWVFSFVVNFLPCEGLPLKPPKKCWEIEEEEATMGVIPTNYYMVLLALPTKARILCLDSL